MKAEANTSHPRCEFVRPKGQIQLLDIEIGHGDGPDVLDAVSLTIRPGISCGRCRNCRSNHTGARSPVSLFEGQAVEGFWHELVDGTLPRYRWSGPPDRFPGPNLPKNRPGAPHVADRGSSATVEAATLP